MKKNKFKPRKRSLKELTKKSLRATEASIVQRFIEVIMEAIGTGFL